MAVMTFEELTEHIGHHIVCVGYGLNEQEIQNVAIECETCSEVLLDYDKEQEKGEK